MQKQQFYDLIFHNIAVLQELYSIADEICLQVPDVDTLIDKLNVAGYLLKKGHRQYQVNVF